MRGSPGGPYIRHPLGALMPRVLKRSACCMGMTMASTSSSICLSRPPMSLYDSVGFSSTSIALTRESYSAGRVSRTRYESLLTPMRSFGRRVAGSTSPTSGRKMVCRVEVLMTAHLPLRCASRSTLAPSPASSSSGSMSRICVTGGSVPLSRIAEFRAGRDEDGPRRRCRRGRAASCCS